MTNAFDDDRNGLLGIPDAVAQAGGQIVGQAIDRVLASDLRVTSAAEGKRLLAEDDDTEEMADTVQRFVGHRDAGRADRAARRPVHARAVGPGGVVDRVAERDRPRGRS